VKVKFSSLKLLAALGAMLSLLVVGTASGAVNGVSATDITLKANDTVNATYVNTADTAAAGVAENQVFVTITDAGANAVSNAIDVLRIAVVNTTRNVSVEVQLSETGANTGIFGDGISDHEGFLVVPVASENITQPIGYVQLLGANDGDTIEVRSTPLFKKITVDSKGPVISGFSPAHSAVTKATTVFFTGVITDAASTLTTIAGGAKPSSTAVAFTVTKAGSSLAATVVYGATGFTKTTTKTSGAVSAWTFSAGLLMGAGTHTFSIVATDSAGNITTSDADAVTAGNQAYSMEVDTTIPSLSSAKTGERWDAATGLIKTDTAARDWIHLQFNADKIDSASLSAADILIGNPGVAPAEMIFVNLASGKTGNATGLDMRDDVFVKNTTTLGPADRPMIRVVGSISDLAGNSTTSGQIDKAVDGIAPALTITVTNATTKGVSTPRAVDQKKVTIRVVSDETIALGVLPTITVNRLVQDAGTTAPIGAKNAGSSATATTEKAVSGIANTFEATIDLSGTGEGLYHVFASISDAASNSGTAGQSNTCTTDDCVDINKAALFEIDDEINNAAAPTFTLSPAQGTSTTKTESTGPFVRVDFNDEGQEYAWTVTGDKIKGIAVPNEIEVDSWNTITLTKVTMDGIDISSSVGSIDANSFNVKTSGLALGTHKLVVNGTDAVGNTYSTDQAFSFTVVARAAYKLTLNPGTNFVSLPGTPTDSAIGTVLAGTNASEVLSWQGGKWQIAAVTAEGKWIGGITDITSDNAYIIKTSTFDSISVEILPRSFDKAPPTVAVKAGWNMVPVIDLALQAQGTTITEDIYFGSLSDGTGTLWKAAYTFDTASQVWSKLLPGALPAVETVVVGKGYWLWATKAGDLVP
jgi:hypothetical protein